MASFLTLKVLVYLFALSASSLAQDLLISKKRFFKDDDDDKKDDDDDDEDDSDYFRGIYIAAGVIGSLILILIFICCLCRCCIRRRQNDEMSASSKTVLAVVPRPRHVHSNSISNESYTGPTYPHSTYGSATAPYDYSNRHSYQNRAYDGYSDSGQYEAPPPYFEHPQDPPQDSISVDIPGKSQPNN